MFVVALMAILAAVLLPGAGADISWQLESVGSVLSSEIGYCRSLAISNTSTYQVDFDVANDRYKLTHTGGAAALDTLPTGVFGSNTERALRRVEVRDLNPMGTEVRLYAVYKMTPTAVAVTDVEFGPLGETTRSEPTVVWLEAGQGGERRWLPVTINPVTGLAQTGEIQVSAP